MWTLKEAVRKQQGGNDTVAGVVAEIIRDIRHRGDEAVREYSARFDNWMPSSG